MTQIINKFKRYIAIVVVFALFIPILLIAQNKLKIEKTSLEITQEDKQIASDISNVTGVKVEEILKMRETGKNWNEILEQLEGKKENNNVDGQNNLLEYIGVEREYISLLDEEFDEAEIIEAKLFVERIVYQLQYITSNQSVQKIQPLINIEENTDSEIEVYTEIEQKVDINKVTYLILKLKNEFGSMETVFNEYLLALQIDLKLEDYITDKENYQKQKEEKSYEIYSEKIITIEKIEQKMLEMIQKENQENSSKILEEEIEESQQTTIQKLKNPLPEVPNPNTEIERYKPENPADKILKEINELNPNENNY